VNVYYIILIVFCSLLSCAGIVSVLLLVFTALNLVRVKDV
jgi:hypothetical protein